MTAIETLFRCPVAVEASGLSPAEMGLFPEERAFIQAAVPKRRAEFATARILARKALGALGAAPIPLVPGPDRAPTWPRGFTGSISHCDNFCAVVVARSTDLISVGLDVENRRELDRAMQDLVLTPAERQWVATQREELRPTLPILIFSAKEAYYKCQYPVTSGFLDFQDVELAIDWASGTYTARVLKPAWPAAVACLSGRFLIDDDRVGCGVELAPG
ncbi:4'-phosphopantetheinyl transferase [Bradyrhizobium sp. ORS 285]|uniref:4'-phosphopantetheinyl transferase family protein n=1 Tax=Bradyrhizobium sp. ORS 285 TaxID=115808 RepID=UPI000557FA0C|nr:4'-phosphopantetheinyl transferase superfamily protein [Bradyrhizobium sp. ORS 285]